MRNSFKLFAGAGLISLAILAGNSYYGANEDLTAKDDGCKGSSCSLTETFVAPSTGCNGRPACSSDNYVHNNMNTNTNINNNENNATSTEDAAERRLSNSESYSVIEQGPSSGCNGIPCSAATENNNWNNNTNNNNNNTNTNFNGSSNHTLSDNDDDPVRSSRSHQNYEGRTRMYMLPSGKGLKPTFFHH